MLNRREEFKEVVTKQRANGSRESFENNNRYFWMKFNTGYHCELRLGVLSIPLDVIIPVAVTRWVFVAQKHLIDHKCNFHKGCTIFIIKA